MNTRKIPAILTLLGCTVAVICTYINGYTLIEMTKVLLCVLLIFLVFGLIVKIIIDKNIPPIEDDVDEVGDEGSVIEKTVEEGDDDGTVTAGNAEEGMGTSGNDLG